MLDKKGTQVPFGRAPADVGARVLGYRYSSQFFCASMGRKNFKKIFLKVLDIGRESAIIDNVRSGRDTPL